MAGKLQYISEEQLRELHEQYKKGTPIRVLVADTWREWGYASARAAEASVYTAWKHRGLYIRTKSEAKVHRVCPNCGCTALERTPGCITCRNRHASRRRKGLFYLKGRSEICKGCGCRMDYTNPACLTCRKRESRRRRRALDAARSL